MIPILPTAEADIARLALRIKTLTEKGLTHSLKKSSGGGKKRKKNGEGQGETKGGGEDSSIKMNGLSTASAPKATKGSIKNAATASLTAKVLQEEERKKRRKGDKDDNFSSLFSSRDQTKPLGKSSDFMSRGFTIPANAKR